MTAVVWMTGFRCGTLDSTDAAVGDSGIVGTSTSLPAQFPTQRLYLVYLSLERSCHSLSSTYPLGFPPRSQSRWRRINGTKSHRKRLERRESCYSLLDGARSCPFSSPLTDAAVEFVLRGWGILLCQGNRVSKIEAIQGVPVNLSKTLLSLLSLLFVYMEAYNS